MSDQPRVISPGENERRTEKKRVTGVEIMNTIKKKRRMKGGTKEENDK